MFDRDDKPPVAAAYVPYRFAGFENIGLTIRAANNNPAALAAAVRSEIRASDAGLPIFDVRTMEDLRRAGFWQFRIFACMGIYATVLFVLGLSDHLADLADPKNDPVGLQLEEEHLPKRIRTPRKPKPAEGD